MKMREMTVHDLPNEIIIKILRFIDRKKLPDTSMTCKRWKELVDSSCQWSVKVRYHNATGFDGQWLNFMRTTKRKFQTIHLNQIQIIQSLDTEKFIKMLQRHGVNAVKLYLVQCQIESFNHFTELLKSMTNLKHLIIAATHTLVGVSVTLSREELPELMKLKALQMSNSDSSIMTCFQKAKLTTLKVRNIFVINSSNNDTDTPLENFLNSQKMLTALTFENTSQCTTSILLIRTPFQLTKLSLENIELKRAPIEHRNLMKLLKTQAKSLTELSLGRGFPNFVFDFVFANMTQLNTLILEGMPQEEEFYEHLAENRSITNLILLHCTGYSKHSLTFFKKLPNIRSVTIRKCCSKEILLAMARSFSKLRSLATYYINEKDFGGVRFHALEMLEIYRLSYKIDWNGFTKAHRQLIKLTILHIDSESLLNNDHIDRITTNVRLQSLKLGQRFTDDKRFYEILRNKCPDLKVSILPENLFP